MNKYNLKDYLQTILSDHQSTFKQTSYDNENDKYLCKDTSTNHVFDFDSYVAGNFDHAKLPASPDAIYIGSKELYFVEFKNQKAADVDTAKIKSKFQKGTEILKNLLVEFTPRDNKFFFCVVFRVQKAPYFNSSHIERNSVKFGLEALNDELGGFYDRIFTNDLDFYKTKFCHLHC